MQNIKLYVTIAVPDDFFEDYNLNKCIITDSLDDIASVVGGAVTDLEIK